MSGFLLKEADAKLKTGMSEESAKRCQFIVAETCSEEQTLVVKESFILNYTPFKVYKGSKDESPFRCKDSDGNIRATKLLNRRVYLRWGLDQGAQTTVMSLGTENGDTDALGTLEA